MSSPAKRRKKNDQNNSKEPRGIEFFFGKQKEKTKLLPEEPKSNDNVDKNGGLDMEAKALTDEELARKLQDEWNRDVAQNGGEESIQTESSISVRKGEIPDPVTSTTPVIPELGLANAAEHSVVERQSNTTLTLQSTAMDADVLTATLPFDESPLTFEPLKYIPDLQRHWLADGGNVSYALLTRCFVLVNATTSRIKIVDTLVNMLRIIIEAHPESLLPAVWLATNAISPPYIDMELGLGGSAISKALKNACGLDSAGLKALYSKHGDPGDVAFEAKKRQAFKLRQPKPLTIRHVYDSLSKIANSKGQGSQVAKQRIVDRLIQDTRGAEESRYIVRTLVQHLRIGAVKTTMLIALSRAFLLSRPPGSSFRIRQQKELASLKREDLTELYHNGEELVKACFSRHPNYNDLIPALLEVGVCEELLIRCGLTLHIPLRPMLGSITRDLGDMLTKLPGRAFSCEYKYDGQRAQVHCDDHGKVSIFSRHLELMTDKYPDLVALVPTIRGEGVRSFILEGEVVAVDRVTGDLRPFQTLSNRARKDVVATEVTVDVCLFAFDLMYLNGEELLNRPFRERRSLLRSLFVEIPHHFTWVKNIDATSADSEAVLEFFKSATDIKCEGIMVKVLDNPPESEWMDNSGQDELLPPKTPTKAKRGPKSKAKVETVDTEGEKPSRRKPLLSTYEPDKRLESWLKVKKDYNAAADTLDLIPIAAWHGSGRKSKWWSPILLAARNPETGQLIAVTKCISGFTDAFYIANRAKYDPATESNVISRPSYVDYPGHPDVWFEPQEVWEIAFADITMSPVYKAAIGLVSDERGLSTRFPRFLKVREDKSIDEATSEQELADLWWKQMSKTPGEDGKGPDGDEELDGAI